MPARKPTKQELADAINLTIEDIIGPDLNVLFCGINPGLYSGATGLHFARPGNRFWKVLYGARFTERLLDPSEEAELLKSGYGITCFVSRTTAKADDLSKDEFIEGGKILLEKLDLYKPKILAVLGLGAYRTAFDRPKAKVGLQAEKFRNTGIWLLPNPSGLNANYQLTDFIELFSELRSAIE